MPFILSPGLREERLVVFWILFQKMFVVDEWWLGVSSENFVEILRMRYLIKEMFVTLHHSGHFGRIFSYSFSRLFIYSVFKVESIYCLWCTRIEIGNSSFSLCKINLTPIFNNLYRIINFSMVGWEVSKKSKNVNS